MPSVDELFSSIIALPAPDRSLLMARLKLELPVYGLDAEGVKGIEEVFEPIRKELSKHCTVPPYQVILKTRVKESFLNSIDILNKYIKKNIKYNNYQDLCFIATNLTKITIDYLTTINIPVSTKTFFEQLSKIEYIVDRAFPNYRISGIIDLILLPEHDLEENE
jgi:hypothetical protein